MRADKIVRTGALLVVVVLAVTLIQVPPWATAVAGGPSVPLPTVPSVPVAPPGHAAPPGGDQTSGDAMHGDQEGLALDPGGGDYTATSLRPSATWDVSAHTGDFSWSYPLRVPPAPGGLEPALSLAYSSSAVDGLTSSTNNQASWIGDGWSMWPGAIERDYRSCAADLTTGPEDERPADLCWRDDNATLSLNGTTTPLVRDADTGTWRPKADDGSRIEPVVTTGNGDNDGESWVVTTVDGTRYHFGTVPAAESTWTVPVYGDDALEPCHSDASFAASGCTQAWRWNLDKIVDRNDNMVLFTYKAERNHYGRNKNSAAAGYDRGGWLHQIRYGLRADDPAVAATAVVDFTPAERCVRDADCTWTKPANLPDVPLNLKCDGGSCPEMWAPTFWSTKLLRTITTKVLRAGTYQPVDSWTLRHELPNPGDGEKPALWLKGITHTGHVGSPVTLPEVTFDGVRKPNRVSGTDGYASLVRYRMNAIVSETGGVVSIGYLEPDCRHGQSMPAHAEHNTMRCFPVRWKPRGAPRRTDYFHKYVVSLVSELDGVAGTQAKETSYEYLDGAGWHWPTGGAGEEDERTWNEFRGFGRVRIRTGSGDDAPRTMVERRFHRGMDGDHLPDGTREATVTDSRNRVRTDSDWLRGFGFETATFEHEAASPAAPPRLTTTITDPFVFGPTAAGGSLQAHVVRTGVTVVHTRVGATERTTRSTAEYDRYGLPTTVSDEGDLDRPEDDRCTTTSYHRDTGRWLMDFRSRTETVAVLCGQTPQFPQDALDDEKTTFDADGNPVRTEVAATRTAGGPVYATTATKEYDARGRVTAATDAMANTTHTAYTPALAGPTTQTVVTAPPADPETPGLITTTTLDPSSGQPVKVVDPNGRVTETAYDALGRRSEIWLPNRPRGTHAQGNVRFAYLVRNDGPIAVTTTRIGPNGRYTSSMEIYDGLLRARQSQQPAPGGGRLLSDTRYDSHGRVYRTTKPYYNDAAVGTDLVYPTDADVPALTLTEYDGAGREVAEVFRGDGGDWRTTTSHGGDRVHVTPRQGGILTTTIFDAHGRTTEIRQHHGSGPDDYGATTYEYTRAGHLATITDPAGNTWRADYDLRGRMTSLDDPDQGLTTMTYDDADRVVSATDAREVTLTFTYDGLGRRTGTRHGAVPLAEWTYDTAFKGKGYPATTSRFVDGREYRTSIGEYNQLYQPTMKSVTIPAADPELAKLAGTYTWFGSYGWDGSLSGEAYPAAGGLGTETVDYELDDQARPLSSSGAHQGTVALVGSVDYTRYGEVERLQLGSGTTRAWVSRYYEHDTRRLSRTVVDAEVPAPMQTDVNYTYDPIGNITSIDDRPAGGSQDTQCFRYDGLRRLTEAWTPAGAARPRPPLPRWAGRLRTGTATPTTRSATVCRRPGTRPRATPRAPTPTRTHTPWRR